MVIGTILFLLIISALVVAFTLSAPGYRGLVTDHSRWFMKDIHMSPEEAVRAHQVLNTAASVAIHLRTFQLAAKSQEQQIQDLNDALDRVEGSRPVFCDETLPAAVGELH